MSKPQKIVEVLDNIYDEVKTRSKHEDDLDKKINEFLSSIHLRDINHTQKRMKYIIKKNPEFSFQFFCNLIEYHENQKDGFPLPAEYYQTIIDGEMEINNNSIEDLEKDYISLISILHEDRSKKYDMNNEFNTRINQLEDKIKGIEEFSYFQAKKLIDLLETTKESFIKEFTDYVKRKVKSE